MEAPLGSAPYQTAECAPSREFAASLAQTAEAVRQTAEEGGMSINWDEFERLRQEASEAVKNNRAGASVRLYGLAISTLMRQIRPRKAS
jgi:hypothetical protein